VDSPGSSPLFPSHFSHNTGYQELSRLSPSKPKRMKALRKESEAAVTNARYDALAGLTGAADVSSAIFSNALLIASCGFCEGTCRRRVVFAAVWQSSYLFERVFFARKIASERIGCLRYFVLRRIRLVPLPLSADELQPFGRCLSLPNGFVA